jgi:hypothetical protein
METDLKRTHRRTVGVCGYVRTQTDRFLSYKRITSVCVQTKIDSIYYTELHVSTYFHSSSGSQLVFKTYKGRTVDLRVT